MWEAERDRDLTRTLGVTDARGDLLLTHLDLGPAPGRDHPDEVGPDFVQVRDGADRRVHRDLEGQRDRVDRARRSRGF